MHLLVIKNKKIIPKTVGQSHRITSPHKVGNTLMIFTYYVKLSFMYLDFAFTLAPWLMSSFTISAYPPEAASISGVESPEHKSCDSHMTSHTHTHTHTLEECKICKPQNLCKTCRKTKVSVNSVVTIFHKITNILRLHSASTHD